MVAPPENSYKKGDTVSPKSNLALKLVVRRYIDRIYYCRDVDDREYAFFEREIVLPLQ